MSPEYALAMTALIAPGRAKNAFRSRAPEVIWSCARSSVLSGSAATTLSDCVFGSNITGKTSSVSAMRLGIWWPTSRG